MTTPVLSFAAVTETPVPSQRAWNACDDAPSRLRDQHRRHTWFGVPIQLLIWMLWLGLMMVEPGKNEAVHWPFRQTGVFIGHALPQPPQFLLSDPRLASQPFAAFMSQSAKPMLHWVMPHWPFRQAPIALAKLQTLPHLPQLFTSTARLFSQPS